jgi:hypothetical protein
VDSVRAVDASSKDKRHRGEETDRADEAKPSMAVFIAGVSTACSKDALVSSAKAVREALSTE